MCGEAGLADCLGNRLGKSVRQDSKLGTGNIRNDRETIGSEANNLSINNLVTPIGTMENSNKLVPRRLFNWKHKNKLDFKSRNKMYNILENIEEMDVQLLLRGYSMLFFYDLF